MKRVFCFGELLMRFSPDLGGDWLRKHSMVVYLGGSELNVATALAAWNIDVEYCTALPQHKLSEEILRHLVSRKLGTSSIYLTGGRIGSYYLPTGTDLHTAVIYDRSHSSFSELVPGKIDWEEVLKDIDWFHFSALSPSLNRNVAAVCREALEVAFRNKIIISVDLNYRPKLWQYGKLPFEIMPSLVHYCNIIMGNIWAAEKMLDISLHIKENGKIDYLDLSEDMSKEILKRYPNCHQVANTFRFTNDGAISYFCHIESPGQNVYIPLFTRDFCKG